VSAKLLGPSEIRALAEQLGVRPTKTLGQNFVHDGGSIRKIVNAAQLSDAARVLEVGPGLGSLTLGLLAAGHSVIAIEIAPKLAAALPQTVAEFAPGVQASLSVPSSATSPRTSSCLPDGEAGAHHPGMGSEALRLDVVNADAMAVRVADIPGPLPTALVANLPYNVAVPILLHLLAELPSLQTALVMVQAEVADRIAAEPGSKIYGVPSAKVAWYGRAWRAGNISRNVFWPVPNVDSALVAFERVPRPDGEAVRQKTFQVIDAAFAQRRKTLRAALAGLFGSAANAETALVNSGIEPSARGETLSIEQFIALANQLPTAPEGR